MTTIIRLLMLIFIGMLHLACNVNDKPCNAKLEQSPELRGFRLGMSMSDVQKHFPGFPSVSTSTQFDLAKVFISNTYASNVLNRPIPIGYQVFSLVRASPFPELDEMKHVELVFVDGRLVKIAIFYPNDIEWESADEFVKKTSEALKLYGSWQKVDSEIRSLYCGDLTGDGFQVYAGFRTPFNNTHLAKTKLPYVELNDFRHNEMVVEKRKREREEKHKQNFKP